MFKISHKDFNHSTDINKAIIAIVLLTNAEKIFLVPLKEREKVNIYFIFSELPRSQLLFARQTNTHIKKDFLIHSCKLLHADAHSCLPDESSSISRTHLQLKAIGINEWRNFYECTSRKHSRGLYLGARTTWKPQRNDKLAFIWLNLNANAFLYIYIFIYRSFDSMRQKGRRLR